MTGLSYLEKINDIDSDLLEASEIYGKKNNIWKFRWLAAAASIMLIATLSVVISNINREKTSNTEKAFVFEETNYELASLSDLDFYEISPARAVESEYEVTKEDCGSMVGKVKVEVDGKTVMCEVYLLASKEEDKKVRILAFPDGRYVIYVQKEEKE